MNRLGVFALAFAAACIAIAAVGLMLHETKPLPPSDFASDRPPTTWPNYGPEGLGFKVPAGEDGPMIAYGHETIARTFANIGPEVPDRGMRFAGNNLTCRNCHLDAGTNRDACLWSGCSRLTRSSRNAISASSRSGSG